MAKRTLNGANCTYENQGGVLVVDLENDGKVLRFIFEDGWNYMVAVLDDKGEVLKTDSVSIDDVVEAMVPKKAATESDED